MRVKISGMEGRKKQFRTMKNKVKETRNMDGRKKGMLENAKG